MRVCVLLTFFALLASGCGIESTVPATSTEPSTTERAVMIQSVSVSGTGSTVTCILNDALVGPGVEIPIFLEFEGDEIQRVTIENQSTYTFSEYNPPTDGNIMCVVEFANAEFESESRSIQNM